SSLLRPSDSPPPPPPPSFPTRRSSDLARLRGRKALPDDPAHSRRARVAVPERVRLPAPDPRRPRLSRGRREPARQLRPGRAVFRSEEHTSELQSRENLVCRLLLEKKKK